MSKRERKLVKEIEGVVVKITEKVTGKVLSFDFSKLPKEIQEKLGPFGLTHKLGDAAAGEAGQDAVDSINKVWEGLLAGNWAVRGARGESVSFSMLNAGIDKLPPKEAEAARALLTKLGILKPPTAAPEAPKK
jgi:hypothetical protein